MYLPEARRCKGIRPTESTRRQKLPDAADLVGARRVSGETQHPIALVRQYDEVVILF